MAPAAPNESLPGEPTNLQRRQRADEDTENVNATSDRRAHNLRDYHQSEIDRLQEEIDVHQAIVDQQDEILNGNLDADTPLPAGTDIAARFNQGEDGEDERPPGNVNELRAQREQARREREGNDNSSTTSDDTSDEFDPTSVNPDDKSPEDKSGDDENDKRRKVADAGGQKAISEGDSPMPDFGREENNGGPDQTGNSTEPSTEGTKSTEPSSTEPSSTPAEPVSDNAPEQDRDKLDDATNADATNTDATKPVSKTPTNKK